MTFPGKVTEADGGKVDGTKVSFTDGDSYRVMGKDKAADSATPSSFQEGAGGSSSIPPGYGCLREYSRRPLSVEPSRLS